MKRNLLLQSSLRIMVRNKLRTLFMSIGVMIGVVLAADDSDFFSSE